MGTGNTGFSGIRSGAYVPATPAPAAWQANHSYTAGQTFTESGTTYIVHTAYTSGSSFGSTDTTNTWTVGGSGGGVTSVAAGDASIIVGGTSSAPTVVTGTLDEIATLHPAAAAVPLNSKKITGLANGTAASDAAAFGQIPPTPNAPYTVTANTTMATNDSMILGNATSGAITITLPSAPTYGAPYVVMKSDSSANAVNVATPAGVINGVTSITYQDEPVLYVFDGTNWDTVPHALTSGGGGGSGGLLSLSNYGPASTTTYTITSTTLTSVDATNLSFSFTAPTSGRVLVRVTLMCDYSNVLEALGLALLDHTTTTIQYGDTTWTATDLGSAGNHVLVAVPFVVSGLASGTAYSMNIAAMVSSGDTGHIYAAGVTGNTIAAAPVTMEVWSA